MHHSGGCVYSTNLTSFFTLGDEAQQQKLPSFYIGFECKFWFFRLNFTGVFDPDETVPRLFVNASLLFAIISPSCCSF